MSPPDGPLSRGQGRLRSCLRDSKWTASAGASTGTLERLARRQAEDYKSLLSGSVRKASDSVIKAARLCRGASTARAMISAGEPQDGASGSLADEGGQEPRKLRLWGRRVEEQPAAYQF